MNTTQNRKLVEFRKGKPVREVAKDIGISAAAISHYENGRRVPKDDIKRKLASYYGTTVQNLFYDEY